MGRTVDVLGPIRVRDQSGQVVEIGRPAQRRLLSILALAGGGRVSTDALIDRFWPDGPPETARAAIQTHISALRNALGNEAIASEAYGYRLNLDESQLDASDFDTLSREAFDRLRKGEYEHVLSLVESALGLWRGEPYVELADDSFSAAERARLHELYLVLTEERIGALIQLGREREVLADLEALVVDHPYRERLWAHLMTARYRLGRNTDALRAFQDVTAHLAEIGVEPGQPLKRLEERIHLHDQFLARTGENLPHEVDTLLASFPKASWPLIGRNDIVANSVEQLRSGLGLALLGVAGIGKSRLLREITNSAEIHGSTVLRVMATETTSTIPFAPFVGLLPENPTQDPLSMISEALHRLRALAGEEGLVLAVDDAHQLDESSLGFLVNVANSAVATICLTARTGEDMSPDLVSLWTDGVVTRQEVEPLSRLDSREVVEKRLGPISERFEDDLFEMAQGNPLLLHEVVEGAISGGQLRKVEGVWTSTEEVASSARLADLVSSRLRNLPPDLRQAMDIVAVGSPLPLGLLTQAVGASVTELRERDLISIAEAVEQSIVTTPHPLYGEVLRANVDESRLREAARSLTEAGMRHPNLVDPLRLAVWQLDSGELVSADVAADGAAAALARHDPALAEQLAERAAAENELAAAMLGRALSYQQRFEEAESVLAETSPSNPIIAGEVASIRAHNLAFGLARIEEAKHILWSAVEDVSSSALGPRLRNERAMLSAMSGDFRDARTATQQVLSDPDADDVSRASAYATLTVAQTMTGDCSGLNSVVVDALDVSKKVKDVLPLVEDQILLMQVTSMAHEGRIPEAVDSASHIIGAADPGDVMKATWLSTLALPLGIKGQLTRSADVARQSLELYSVADPFGLEAQARGHLALALGQQGLAESADPIDGLEMAVPQPRLVVWVGRGRAWSQVVSGDLDAAVTTLIETAQVAVAGEHFAWAALCLHDVVRLAEADGVSELFDQLPKMDGALLLENMHAHSRALTSIDAEALATVADRFAAFGTWLLAAEAWAQAATAVLDDELARARYVSKSKDAEARCEDADTPALRSRPQL